MTKKDKTITWVSLFFSAMLGSLLGYYLFSLGYTEDSDAPFWLALFIAGSWGFILFAFLALWIPWIIRRYNLW